MDMLLSKPVGEYRIICYTVNYNKNWVSDVINVNHTFIKKKITSNRQFYENIL